MRELFPEIADIGDDALQEACTAVLATCITSGNWEDPHELPFLPEFMHTRFTNIVHTRDVVALATVHAQQVAHRWDLNIPNDLVVAAALLHDASKWVEYTPTPDHSATTLTRRGRDLPHPYLAVVLAEQAGLPAEVVNAIAAHSVSNDIAASSIIGVVVHHADMVAMDAALLEVGSPTVCKVRRKHPTP